MIKNIKWLLIASVSLVACNDEEAVTAPVLPATAGSANFSNYVSLGNSLTAGFSDNALFKKGQENSYPVILSQQFAQVGGGQFKVPFMNDNIGGLLFGGAPAPNVPNVPVVNGGVLQFAPRLYLAGFLNATTPNITTVSPQGTQTTEASTVLAGPFNNMGVPGAKSFHLLAAGYGSAFGNPYFRRFASAPSTTILADAVAQNPTFFSLWIGNNDVLSYATSGGKGINQTANPDPSTYGPDDITNPGTFASVIGTLVDGLTAGGAKGVLANIPYVTSIPFFTTVPANPLTTFSAAQAAQLNASIYGPLDRILTALGEPDRFIPLYANDNNPGTTKDANPLLIIDETLTDYSAQITAGLAAAGVPPAQAGLFGNLYGKARQAVGVLRRDENSAVIGTTSNVSDYVNPSVLKTDYILLTTRSKIGINFTTTLPPGFPPSLALNGISYPLQDDAVLTADETMQIKTAVDQFNLAIKAKADAKGLAFVDTNAVLSQVASSAGFRYGNFQVTSAFITGGAFSLDGVHPSARGQALIANKFLEAINAKYGATLKMVNIGNYQIQYPLSL